MRPVVLLLSVCGYALASINEGMSDSLDGEVAMKNLEAAQVKMEEKLNSMTNFIDQELSKAKDSPVSSGYSKKRRKRSAQENPLRSISVDTVNDIMASIKSLDAAFSSLQKAYEEYKNSQTSSPDGQQPVEGAVDADSADAEGVDADGADTQGANADDSDANGADAEGVDTDGAEDGEDGGDDGGDAEGYGGNEDGEGGDGDAEYPDEGGDDVPTEDGEEIVKDAGGDEVVEEGYPEGGDGEEAEIVDDDVADAEGGGDEPSEAARRRHRRMRRRRHRRFH